MSEILNILVEVPKGSRNKYEWDEELGAIKLDLPAAQRKAAAFKAHVDSLFDRVDALLCPSAPGEAPAGVWIPDQGVAPYRGRG